MKYANFKRMTAMTMAAAMMCSPVVTMAADPTLTTGGSEKDAFESANENEGITGESDLKYLNKNVKAVYLPTVTADQLKFTLDPQGLLNVTSATKFSLGKGAIYFANTGSNGTTYSNTSDPLLFYNASSVDMDATVSVSVKALPDGVKLAATEEELEDATEPMIYLALKGVNKMSSKTAKDDGVAMALTKSGADTKNTYTTLTAAAVGEVEATKEAEQAGYYVKVTGDDISATYTYELSSKFVSGKHQSVKDEGTLEYVLTGKCSEDSEGWDEILEQQNASTAVKAEIKVTWELAEGAGVPKETTVTAESISVDGGDVVTVTFPKGVEFSKLSYQASGSGDWNDLTVSTHYTITDVLYGKEITFKDLTSLNAAKVKIVASVDNEDNDVEINVEAAAPAAPVAPTASATSIKNNGGTVDITYPAGTSISEIQKLKSDGVSYNTLPTSYYTLSDISNGKKLELKDVFGAYPAATKIKVIFSTGEPVVLSVTAQ